MTEKRFTLKYIEEQHLSANLYDDKTFIGSIRIGAELIVELLNSLNEENEELKSELAEKRQEQKVIEYLQAYHKGDVNELKKELQE